MHNHSRTFFSRREAEAFAEYLRTQPTEDVQVWIGTDAFRQTTYDVRWNTQE